MVRQVLFLSSIVLILVFQNSCVNEKSDLKFFNKENISLTQSGGIFYLNHAPFTGILFSLSPNQKDTLAICSFLNGREHGTWKKFYANGTKQEVRYFVQGKKEGEYTGWWEDGTKKFEFHFEDDEYEGLCKEWADNGQITHEGNYVHGHETGAQKAWYTNGKIKSNYTIIDGRRYGLLGTKNCKNVSDSVFNR